MTALRAVVMVHTSAQELVSPKINEQFLLQFHAQENLNRQKIVPSGVVQVGSHFTCFTIQLLLDLLLLPFAGHDETRS